MICILLGRIAQLAEQLTLNQRVLGSSPSAPTIFPKKSLRNQRLHLDSDPVYRAFYCVVNPPSIGIIIPVVNVD